jgi:CheY-like chemotaxis protein
MTAEVLWMALDLKIASEPHHPICMVVDDDDLIREIVTELLEELFTRVYQASDGLEGLATLADHPDISLIVTDIAMPRLDGIGLAAQARQTNPDLKVLFISARQRPPACETFLEKPFPRQALVSAVQGLMDAH